jgi:hypothetical protein
MHRVAGVPWAQRTDNALTAREKMIAPEWGNKRWLLGLADQESLVKEVHAFVANAFGNEPVRLKFGS